MATLYSRRAMKRADDANPHQLTWADIERPEQPPSVDMPRIHAAAYMLAFVCGVAAGAAFVLIATGQA
jgi:hypothetical protein